MSKISATIVADSISPQGHRAASIIGVIPRIVLSELNTHRMLSKNSASSRAIPSKRMIEMVKKEPFMPIAWQKEHTGMQGTEYWTTEDKFPTSVVIGGQTLNNSMPNILNAYHLEARDNAIESAIKVMEAGGTKQIANRYLEPFMWHTVLITATEYENFFELRCPQFQMRNSYGVHLFKSRKDYLKQVGLPDERSNYGTWTDLDWLKLNKGGAEIHISTFAECIWDAMNESKPKLLKPGEWHIPFEDKIDYEKLGEVVGKNNITYKDNMAIPPTIAAVRLSTAMGARTSYTTVGDEKEVKYETLIGIHDKMAVAKPFHASPFEHPNRCMTEAEYFDHRKTYVYNGPLTERMIAEEKADTMQIYRFDKKKEHSYVITEYGWCRNMRGFIQYRALLENK